MGCGYLGAMPKIYFYVKLARRGLMVSRLNDKRMAIDPQALTDAIASLAALLRKSRLGDENLSISSRQLRRIIPSIDAMIKLDDEVYKRIISLGFNPDAWFESSSLGQLLPSLARLFSKQDSSVP